MTLDPSDMSPTGAMPAPAPAEHASGLATMFPGYFALVMATGIIAIGAFQQRIAWLADSLHALATVAYVVLVMLTIARLIVFPRRVLADLTSHAHGFAFLTIVAATIVLGEASGLIRGWWTLAWVLWWVSLALWAAILYSVLFAVVLGKRKPGLDSGINGTWFLLTVSTEGVAVLGALLFLRHPSDALAFVCLAMFGLGIVLYLIVMTMVFLRWTFQHLDPTEADPPAWIAAGAVAITVLAGSNLLLASRGSLRLSRVAPFIEGMVVLAWATSTFWFPLMIAIGVWRHVVRRLPVRYDPTYWALVFPLGMYGVATFRMNLAIGYATLSWLPKVALTVALLAWCVVFAGLLGTGGAALLARRRARASAG